MKAVKVEITKLVDESNPGWVECSFIDAKMAEHVFTEKVPVVSNEEIDKESKFPQFGVIACQIVEGESEKNTVIIDTEFPWGIESNKGISKFCVNEALICDL